MPTTYTSTTTGGNWNEPSTWLAGSGYPASTDTAIINTSGAGYVELNASATGIVSISGTGKLSIATPGVILTTAGAISVATLDIIAASSVTAYAITSSNLYILDPTNDAGTRNITCAGAITTCLSSANMEIAAANTIITIQSKLNGTGAETAGWGNITCASLKIHGGSLDRNASTINTTQLESNHTVTFNLGTQGVFNTTAVCKMYGYIPMGGTPVSDMPNVWTAQIAVAASTSATEIIVTGDVRDWNNLVGGAGSIWITQIGTPGLGVLAYCRYTIKSATPITYSGGMSTITLTDAKPLAQNKAILGHVIFESRNILVNSTGTQTTMNRLANQIAWGTQFGTAVAASYVLGGGTACKNNSLHDCSFFSCNYAINGTTLGNDLTGSTITGGPGANGAPGSILRNMTFAGASTGTTGLFMGNLTNSLFTGCTSCLSSAWGCIITGCKFYGNSTGINQGSQNVGSGLVFQANSTALSAASCVLDASTFGSATAALDNTKDMDGTVDCIFRNCTFDSGTNIDWTSISSSSPAVVWSQTKHLKADSFNHSNITGQRKCWTLGGYVVNPVVNAVPATPTYSRHLQMVCTDANYWTFLENEYTLRAGKSYKFTCEIQRNTSDMSTNPIFELVDKFSDTLDMGGTALASTTMTYSKDTWEILSLTYTPTVTTNAWLRVRAIGTTSQYVWFTMFQDDGLTASISGLSCLKI